MVQSRQNTEKKPKTLIAVGSNVSPEISDAASIVQKCRLTLQQKLQKEVLSSRIFRSPAFPLGNGPDFANAVFGVEPYLDPRELLDVCHQIEAEFGRTRTTRWAPRVLDLDVLDVDGAVLPDQNTWSEWSLLPLDAQMERTPDQLILPHPRLADRAFVLVPLADIRPDWHHPVTGASLREMLDALPASDIVAIQPLP